MSDETAQNHDADEEATVIYNSQPIANYRLGPWQFENGVLKLTPTESVAFEKVWKAQPMIERNRVTKIDIAAAEAIIAQIVPAATQNADSSAGRAALLNLQAQMPKMGVRPVDTPKSDSDGK